jgi:hypothetical protein
MEPFNLKELSALFTQSALDERLPRPVRAFAAQCLTLSAHVERVENKVDAETQARKDLATKNEKLFSELIDHIGTLPNQVLKAFQAQLAATRNGSAAAVPVPSAGDSSNGSDGGGSEDEDAAAMAARVIRESQAEVAEIESRSKTPVPPPRQPNGGKPQPVGDAS